MAITYFPFDAGTGASVTEAQWGQMAQLWLPTGVVSGQLNQFNVYADSTGMQVKVDTGVAWVQGFYCKSDTLLTIPIATAPTSNSRIDRVVLQVDWTNNNISVVVVTGAVAASPVEPALTQNSSIWQIPLARVTVGTNIATIAAGNVTDERKIVNNTVSSDSQTITRNTNYTGTQQIVFSNLANKTIKHIILYAIFNAGGISRASWGISVNNIGAQDKCIYSGQQGFAFDYYSIIINGSTTNDYLRAHVQSFDISGVTLSWETGGVGLAAGQIIVHAVAIAE